MTSIITRRSIPGGLISAMAAPAVVRASSLMPVRAIRIGEPGLIVYGISPAMMDGLPDLRALQCRAYGRVLASHAVRKQAKANGGVFEL